MKNSEIIQYLETKDVQLLHTWVANNYKVFHSIVAKTIKHHGLYSVDAEDLFSEAIIIFYSVIDRYDPARGEFSTFLYKAIGNDLVNKSKHLIRKDFQSRVDVVNLDEEVNSDEGKSTSVESLVADEGIKSSMNHTLVALLSDYVEKNCDDKVRAIYTMYCQGYPLVDIAKSMHVSKQYISQTMQRLTEKVREEWRVNEQ